jgi:hypothetical protein
MVSLFLTVQVITPPTQRGVPTAPLSQLHRPRCKKGRPFVEVDFRHYDLKDSMEKQEPQRLSGFPLLGTL